MASCWLPHPSSSDGLSLIQRAVFRYLCRHAGFVRCSVLVSDLMGAPDCPSELTYADVDAVMLAMSHPSLNLAPLLAYAGAQQSADGWLPGAYYRMVALGPVGRGLLAGPDDGEDIWSLRPLTARWPVALLHGCCSWDVETESSFEDHPEQAPRRMRCKAIHCPALPLVNVERLLDDGRRAHLAPQWVHSVFAQGSIPQGIMAAIEGRWSGGQSSPHVVCLPRWEVLAHDRDSSRRFILVRQPTCGRHFGQELARIKAEEMGFEAVLRRAGGGLAIAWASEEFCVPPDAGLTLALDDSTSALQMKNCVPIEPLSDSWFGGVASEE